MATRSKTRPAPKFVRFRVNVPADDQESLAFVASQANLSASLRKLMHDHVENVGLTDATSAPVTPDQLQAAVSAGGSAPRRARGKAAKALEESAKAAGDAPAASPQPKPAHKVRSTAEESVPDYPDPNDAIRQMMGV